jgi:hypothetical protein
VLDGLLDSRWKKVVASVGAVAVLGGVGLLLTAGGEEEAAPPTTTTAAIPPEVAPLTGVAGDFEGRIQRPALVVKIDNGEPDARPQAGLNAADVVYEERVEGSVTRLLAVFHSTDAAPIGPVRSARTSDIAIFTPLNRPFFAWSGANATFAQRIRAAEIVDVGFDARTDAYYREPNRRAPSNLMLESSATIQALPVEDSGPPSPLFQYVSEGTETAGLVATPGVAISFGSSGGSAPVEYRWNGAGWARTQKGTAHVDEDGTQVAPANVIVQFVDYVGTDVNDQFDNPIPEAQLLGEGEAWVFTQGGLVRGRWAKPDLTTPTAFTDADGAPILLAPGRTWVALPPPGGARTL